MMRSNFSESGRTLIGNCLLSAAAVVLTSGCATTIRMTGVQFAEGDPMKICIEDPAACGERFVNSQARPDHSSSESDPLHCRVEGPQEKDEWTGTHKNNLGFACTVDESVETPKGAYLVQTQVSCAPKYEQTISVDAPWSGKFTVELPKPRRAFLDANTGVGLFPASLKAGLHKTSDWTNAPAFTEVDVLRDWKGPSDERTCSYSVARIIDAGGVLPPGTLVILQTTRLTDTRPQGSSASASVNQNKESALRQEQSKQADNEKFAAVAAKEIRTGKCSEERTDELRALLPNMKSCVENMDRDAVFTLVAHEFYVASPTAVPLSIRLGRRGEYHLFAVSHRPVQIELKDRNGSTVKTQSLYHEVASNFGGGYDSRSVEANAGDKATVKLSGGGCALITVFHKL
jgi:hypothetical protein